MFPSASQKVNILNSNFILFYFIFFVRVRSLVPHIKGRIRTEDNGKEGVVENI